MDNRPIGVFDSGFGGLTVLNRLSEILPNEDIIYFGDNGRAPYGTKSTPTVRKYTLQDANFLYSKGVKIIVVACNTASALALDVITDNIPLPVIEVVKPGASEAIKQSQNRKIGVIGTQATIQSGVYESAIRALRKEVHVYKKACPMFVPLVEEGWWDNEIAYMIVKEYLAELKDSGIDTLVLGCTHYPLLSETIVKYIGNEIKLVSSADAVVKKTYQILSEKDMFTENSSKGSHDFYTSDDPEKFRVLGSAILNKEISKVEKIEIDKF